MYLNNKDALLIITRYNNYRISHMGIASGEFVTVHNGWYQGCSSTPRPVPMCMYVFGYNFFTNV